MNTDNLTIYLNVPSREVDHAICGCNMSNLTDVIPPVCPFVQKKSSKHHLVYMAGICTYEYLSKLYVQECVWTAKVVKHSKTIYVYTAGIWISIYPNHMYKNVYGQQR